MYSLRTDASLHREDGGNSDDSLMVPLQADLDAARFFAVAVESQHELRVGDYVRPLEAAGRHREVDASDGDGSRRHVPHQELIDQEEILGVVLETVAGAVAQSDVGGNRLVGHGDNSSLALELVVLKPRL